MPDRGRRADGAGKSGGDALRADAQKFRGGAEARRSNGSDGKVASLVDKATYTKAGGSDNGAAFVLKSDTNKMFVNRGNSAGFFAGAGNAKWILGHESLHTAGIFGHARGTNNALSYKWGEAPQREAFRQVTGTPAAANDPEHLVEQMYPNFSGP